MTPEIALEMFDEIMKDYGDDSETTHAKFDDILEEIAMQHGYDEFVKKILETTRWYS